LTAGKAEEWEVEPLERQFSDRRDSHGISSPWSHGTSSPKDLPVEAQRRLAADLVAEIESDAAAERQRTGSQVLGVAAIQGQEPHKRPERSKKSPAPLFHALTKAARQDLYAGYAWFVAAFREAAAKLREGSREVSFPTGSFPPAMPFAAG